MNNLLSSTGGFMNGIASFKNIITVTNEWLYIYNK